MTIINPAAEMLNRADCTNHQPDNERSVIDLDGGVSVCGGCGDVNTPFVPQVVLPTQVSGLFA